MLVAIENDRIRHHLVYAHDRVPFETIHRQNLRELRLADRAHGGHVGHAVLGGAAETRRSGTDDFTAASVSWHHFVDLNVFADHLLVRGVNQSGRVFDQVTIPVSES